MVWWRGGSRGEQGPVRLPSPQGLPGCFSHSPHPIGSTLRTYPEHHNTHPAPSTPAQSCLTTSPRAAHVQSGSLCALSCTISFQLELDHVVSCSKASDLRTLTYKKALFYVSFENSFFLATHGMRDPRQGLNPHPLWWKLRVLTPGPPGKSCSENSSLASRAYILLQQ